MSGRKLGRDANLEDGADGNDAPSQASTQNAELDPSAEVENTSMLLPTLSDDNTDDDGPLPSEECAAADTVEAKLATKPTPSLQDKSNKGLDEAVQRCSRFDGLLIRT